MATLRLPYAHVYDTSFPSDCSLFKIVVSSGLFSFLEDEKKEREKDLADFAGAVGLIGIWVGCLVGSLSFPALVGKLLLIAAFLRLELLFPIDV